MMVARRRVILVVVIAPSVHAVDAERFAVIDLETTGFSPIDDRVVEMACVIVDRGHIVETWSTLVHPARAIPWYATRVHGITDGDVAFAPPFAFAQRALENRCARATIVAHNARFDLGFLPSLAGRPSVCTVALARRAFPDAPNYRNQSLREYLAITVPARYGRLVAHRALADALVTAHVLLRCFAAEALEDALDVPSRGRNEASIMR